MGPQLILVASLAGGAALAALLVAVGAYRVRRTVLTQLAAAEETAAVVMTLAEEMEQRLAAGDEQFAELARWQERVDAKMAKLERHPLLDREDRNAQLLRDMARNNPRGAVVNAL